MKKHSTHTFSGSRHELMTELDRLTSEGFFILSVIVDPTTVHSLGRDQNWLVIMYRHA